ncbi:MAG TPA: efflux RND transporter periplasmic adaptor subunit [Candidatus Binatia bacterium]|nr:efflux RND transporter periplasmic adaptor subunit [Candidatus Binatia bacterium]
MKISSRPLLWTIVIVLAVFFPGCREKAATGADHDEPGDRHEAEAKSSLALTPAAIAAANIQTTAAARHVFRRRITASGELGFNPRRLTHLTARTTGRVERVLAVSGDRVRQGQLLAEMYSPDFLSLQAEYLQSAERAKRFGGDPSEAGAARAILESARTRLVVVGVTPAEIDALGRDRIPHPLLPVRAPFAGTVIETGVLAGDHVELGASMFRLADLSVLWASLHIRETDLAAIEAASKVELRAQAYPGEIFAGELLLVGDVVDEKTRTLIARVHVPNPSAKLKVGMFIEAVLAGRGERSVLAVPESAVQDDEGTPIVFVATGKGMYRRHEVEIGERDSGLVEIRRGLAAGETVVTTGSFLLKSEMRKGSMVDEHGHS